LTPEVYLSGLSRMRQGIHPSVARLEKLHGSFFIDGLIVLGDKMAEEF
jgi:hypothetical protein